MKISLAGQKGLGLIESILTLLIIAGAAIALLRFQNYLQYSNNVTQQQSNAVELAVNEIETLRDFTTLSGYQSLASGSSTSAGVTTTYTITWTITPTTTPSYSKIDVTVTWTDRYGTSHTIEQTSNVAGIDPSFEAVVMT